MQMTIHSTNMITKDPIHHVECRVWEGVTENGVPCLVFVKLLAVKNGEDTTQFERELQERLAKAEPIDLRHVL
jgi:hypothetical protein